MEENKKNLQESEPIEYEDVKHLSMGAFVGLGAALGVAIGVSIGNMLLNNFLLSVGAFAGIGMISGVVLGILNKRNRHN